MRVIEEEENKRKREREKKTGGDKKSRPSSRSIHPGLANPGCDAE
jgi:hypothetical protein